MSHTSTAKGATGAATDTPTHVSPAAAARASIAALDGGDAVALAVVVEANSGAESRRDAQAIPAGRRLLLSAGGDVRGTTGDPALDEIAANLARRALKKDMPVTETVELAGTEYMLYAESVRAPDELVVVGAGHIAVPLARLGVMLGFRTTVLDDREEFAAVDRFHEDARVQRVNSFDDPFRGLAIGRRSYIVLVTRGHAYDFDCLRDLVAREEQPRYIGMIGSRRRVKAAFKALLDAGIPRERLARVHAPVGLDIGAETPEEIAVSIAAEMVSARRGGGRDVSAKTRSPHPLRDSERVLERLLPESASNE